MLLCIWTFSAFAARSSYRLSSLIGAYAGLWPRAYLVGGGLVGPLLVDETHAGRDGKLESARILMGWFFLFFPA